MGGISPSKKLSGTSRKHPNLQRQSTEKRASHSFIPNLCFTAPYSISVLFSYPVVLLIYSLFECDLSTITYWIYWTWRIECKSPGPTIMRA